MTVLSKGIHHMTQSYFYVEVLSGHGHHTRLSFVFPYAISFAPSIRRQNLYHSEPSKKWLQNHCRPVEALKARLSLLALLTRRELTLPSIGDCRGLALTIFRLYCTNLPDRRIQKQDLRTALYALFSTYGTVLDIVCMKTNKMRGQAHIVFRDVQASTQALRALQGFEFFGKPMVRSHCASIVATPRSINGCLENRLRQRIIKCYFQTSGHIRRAS